MVTDLINSMKIDKIPRIPNSGVNDVSTTHTQTLSPTVVPKSEKPSRSKLEPREQPRVVPPKEPAPEQHKATEGIRRFTIYKPSGYAVVTIVDPDTGNVIGQFPPAKPLDGIKDEVEKKPALNEKA